MSDDDFISYQRKLVGWFLAGLVSSVGINQGIQKTTSIRYDPFTGHDAERLEERVMDYVDQRFKMHNTMIPPEATRKRIRYIERFLENKHQDFNTPTYHWGKAL